MLLLRHSNILHPAQKPTSGRTTFQGGRPADLKPAFEDLAALAIARLVTMKAGRASSQESLLAAFLAQAETCQLAVLPGCSGLSEHRALLCARAGLVVLRGQCRDEPVGETTAGALVLSDATLAWVRAITELMVDPH